MNRKVKIFAVSDIHGHATLLKSALHDAGFLPNDESHLLIVCGDCFDRGTENRAVLKFLHDVKNKIIIRGNHEDRLMHVLEACRLGPVDYHNGTDVTVKEFLGEDDVTDDGFLYPDPETVDTIREFIGKTYDYFETEDYVFVHGYVPLDTELIPPDILEDWRHAPNSVWPYARFIGWQDVYPLNIGPKGKTVVCGHRSTNYATRFDSNRGSDDYSPFVGNCIMAIDACTIVSHKVNVVVLEDSVDISEHHMSLRDEPFENIKNGIKRVEMRLFDEKRQRIRVGDTISFTRDADDGEHIKTRVIGIYRYNDFNELTRDFKASELGFPNRSSNYVSGYMSSIYDSEKIEKYGTIAIRISPM